MRSFGLAAAVTSAAVIIGVFAAWVVARSPIVPRRALIVVFSMSLAIPSYLSAFAWVSWIPQLNGFIGAALVLTFVCYPFVMLPVAASLQLSDPLTEDVARSLGRSPLSTFFSVTLGQVRSSVAGGALLVALYVLSDFGAVAAMRYEVFTWVIYGAYRAGFNPSRAAILSIVLIAAAFALTAAEIRIRSTSRVLGSGVRRAAVRAKSSRQMTVAIVGSLAIVGIGVGVPVGRVVFWMVSNSHPTDFAELARAIASSFQVGIMTSIVTVAVALPISIAAARFSSPFTRSIEGSTYVVHALPGIVVAISMVFVGIRLLKPIYQQLPLLIAAQVIIFIPLAVSSIRSSIEMSRSSVEDVARSLGAGNMATVFRVTIPLALPGILAAGAMTMLSSVKELPAALLLRPIGLETLATNIWKFSSVSDYSSVGPYALAMVLLAVVPVAVLTATSQIGHRA
jgi:iron(III) transport system permease protein